MKYSDLPYAKAPDGICRWCGKKTKGRRSRWCSEECNDEYYIRSSSSSVRYHVKHRDKGICSLCGLDTSFLWWLHNGLNPYRCSYRYRNLDLMPAYELFKGALIALGYNFAHVHGNQEFWDADHIKPVSEGGGWAGLDNYRTLCVPCHKAETARMHWRQARRRQLMREPELFVSVDDI